MKKVMRLQIIFLVIFIAIGLFIAGSTAIAQPESTAEMTIDIWYGNAQKFGREGNPQQWVNILGNVSPADEVAELTYVLNSKPKQELSIGTANRRLVNPGDFNIEIDTKDLKGGTNTITIQATAKDGSTEKEKFSFTYTRGRTWPANYTADWSSSSNIYDIAQVVDGKWAIESNKLVTKEAGYERLVAIGDVGSTDKGIWTDYEITVPVTVKSLDETGYGGLSNGPAVGLYLRWQGHTLREDEQPRVGTERSGAQGRYHWKEKDGEEGLEIKGVGWRKPLNTTKKWELNTPYILKMSVQSVDDSTKAYYRLKFWKQGEMEPGTWDVEGFSDENNIPSGSVLLAAHHVDAEFGNVQVRRLSDLEFTLTATVSGSGTLAVSPDLSKYEYGEKVSLTAVPDPGYYLESWSGDMSQPGTVNPLEFNITKDMSITANFTEVLPGTLTVNVEGQGTVTKDPDKASYEGGEAVTLTAVPEPGYRFKEWSGDLSGTLNPAVLAINGDMTVTAVFEEAGEISPISDDFNRCELYTELWTFVNPSSLGAIAVDPTASQVLITAPAAPTMTLWNSSRDAPRIMQDTADQDFTVEIKFDSIPEQNNQFQGFVVEQDADNWIRFDFLNKNGDLRLFAGTTTDGVSTSVWNESINLGGASELYMRITRLGDTWAQAYSTDGINWQTPQNAPSFDHALLVASSGIFAGNENGASAPDFVLRADYVRNTAFPGGISGYLLALDVTGAGTVELDPQPDENSRYICNQQVTLTAAPVEKFIGWSGDLTGTETTVTLTMDGDKAVTATFFEEFVLTTEVIGEGTLVVEPDQETYEAGDEVTLTAVPAEDFYFAGWSGDASGITNPLTVMMDSDKSITAIFDKSSVYLPVIMSPES